MPFCYRFVEFDSLNEKSVPAWENDGGTLGKERCFVEAAVHRGIKPFCDEHNKIF